MLPLLLAGLLVAADSLPEPIRIVRTIQRSVDRDGARALESDWRRKLAREPNDSRALLAVGTFERQRYRYDRSDSLLLLLGDKGPAWRAVAAIGMAQWRSLGSDPVRADSLYSRARQFAQQAGTPAIEAEAVQGLAQIRQRTQGPRAGLQLLTEWWALLAQPSAEDSAQRTCLTAALEEQLGDASALGRGTAGAKAAERLKAWRLAGTCRLLVAQSADRRGYAQGASLQARTAVAHFERIHYDVGIALASQWYGYVLVRRSEYADARANLERALATARLTRFGSVEGWAHSGLAQLYLELGDLGQARRHAELAAASHAARRDLWGLANARRFEATALELSGDIRGAGDRYLDAERAFRDAGLVNNALPVMAARVTALMRLGLLDSAERALGAADVVGRTVEGWRKVESPRLRGELAMQRGQLGVADSALRTSVWSQRWRNQDLDVSAITIAIREAQVALRQGRVAVAESALAVTTRSLAESRRNPANGGFTSALAELRKGTSTYSDAYPDVVAQLVRRGRTALAFEFVEQLRARDIVDRQLRRVALLRDTTAVLAALRVNNGIDAVATIAELRRALAPDEAWVTYMLGVDATPGTAIVVTRDTVAAFSLPTRDELLPDIRTYSQLAAAGTEPVGASKRLGAALVAPVLAALPSSVTRLMLSPDGDLHRVPFDILRLPDGRFVLERATVSIAPSATALLALRARSGAPGERVVALGDPRYPRERSGRSERLAAEPSAAFDAVRLPRLTHSGEEAARVGRYGRRSTVLVREAASEGAVMLHAVRDVGVLHFATHALIDENSQEGTALALAASAGSDGFLTAGEVSHLTLHGALVVLSACGSSGGLVMAGEGLRGLTAPLLEAGARAVVATHWSIGDRSVVPFVDRFYAAMARGARVDDALRQAKLAAIRDGVSIADWGAFSVTGDGSVRVPLQTPSSGVVPWLEDRTEARRDTSPR